MKLKQCLTCLAAPTLYLVQYGDLKCGQYGYHHSWKQALHIQELSRINCKAVDAEDEQDLRSLIELQYNFSFANSSFLNACPGDFVAPGSHA